MSFPPPPHRTPPPLPLALPFPLGRRCRTRLDAHFPPHLFTNRCTAAPQRTKAPYLRPRRRPSTSTRKTTPESETELSLPLRGCRPRQGIRPAVPPPVDANPYLGSLSRRFLALLPMGLLMPLRPTRRPTNMSTVPCRRRPLLRLVATVRPPSGGIDGGGREREELTRVRDLPSEVYRRRLIGRCEALVVLSRVSC